VLLESHSAVLRKFASDGFDEELPSFECRLCGGIAPAIVIWTPAAVHIDIDRRNGVG